MVSLAIPTDVELLQAAGRVAFAHGQLEQILRMTVKNLSGFRSKKHWTRRLR